jgi:hypothetical protein
MIHSKTERSLAGLQAGMLGGIVMIALLALVSMLDRRSWWSYPNLLSACFYGPKTIVAGLGWPTVAGAALQLVIAAAAGALFGAAFGNYTGTRRLALFALLWGLFVFFACEQCYRYWSPTVIAYMPRSAVVVAHLVYGLCLAAISRIGAAPGSARAGTMVATPAQEPAATVFRSGSERPESTPPQVSREDEHVIERDGEPAG